MWRRPWPCEYHAHDSDEPDKPDEPDNSDELFAAHELLEPDEFRDTDDFSDPNDFSDPDDLNDSNQLSGTRSAGRYVCGSDGTACRGWCNSARTSGRGPMDRSI